MTPAEAAYGVILCTGIYVLAMVALPLILWLLRKTP